MGTPKVLWSSDWELGADGFLIGASNCGNLQWVGDTDYDADKIFFPPILVQLL